MNTIISPSSRFSSHLASSLGVPFKSFILKRLSLKKITSVYRLGPGPCLSPVTDNFNENLHIVGPV